jgi:hypothetical protein
VRCPKAPERTSRRPPRRTHLLESLDGALGAADGPVAIDPKHSLGLLPRGARLLEVLGRCARVLGVECALRLLQEVVGLLPNLALRKIGTTDQVGKEADDGLILLVVNQVLMEILVDPDAGG